jgi:hypothetical protein
MNNNSSWENLEHWEEMPTFEPRRVSKAKHKNNKEKKEKK